MNTSFNQREANSTRATRVKEYNLRASAKATGEGTAEADMSQVLDSSIN